MRAYASATHSVALISVPALGALHVERRLVDPALRGHLSLLIGMVRASQPTQVVARLSRALVGALGTGAFALTSSNVWQLATAQT